MDRHTRSFSWFNYPAWKEPSTPASPVQEGYQSFGFFRERRIPLSTGELFNRRILRQTSVSSLATVKMLHDKFNSWYGSFSRSYDFNMHQEGASLLGVDESTIPGDNTFLPVEPSLYDSFEGSGERDLLLPNQQDFRMSTPIFEEEYRSSTAQTLFNSVNLFIGIGLLSMPYTFRTGGWVLGPALILFSSMFSRYTLRLLIKAMDISGAATYSDLGEKTFGKWGRIFITSVLFGELFSCACTYVVLVGDTLSAIFKDDGDVVHWYQDADVLKSIAFFCIMLPTTLIRSLKILSVGSLIGIITSFSLGLIVLINAFTKEHAPGSIWEAAPTDLLPSSLKMWLLTPVSLGMIMYNFSGAAVIPNLYRDMRRPEKISWVLNWTFVIITGWFMGFCCLCYFMFGTGTLEEITFNLSNEPAYNVHLNMFLLWMIVLNPLTKFALMLNPVCLNLELSLIRPMFMKYSRRRSEDQGMLNGDESTLESFPAPATSNKYASPVLYHSMTVMLRVAVALLAYLLAILYPNFTGMLAFIGTFFSFTVSAVFPILAYLRVLSGRIFTQELILLYTSLIFSIVMVFVGVIWLPVIQSIYPQ